jgi:hypothetical protein
MKKIILLTFTIIFLVSCSKIDIDQSSPELVVKEFISSCQSANYKKAYALYKSRFGEKQAYEKFKKAMEQMPPFSSKTQFIIAINGNSATAKIPDWGDSMGIDLIKIDAKWWITK